MKYLFKSLLFICLINQSLFCMVEKQIKKSAKKYKKKHHHLIKSHKKIEQDLKNFSCDEFEKYLASFNPQAYKDIRDAYNEEYSSTKKFTADQFKTILSLNNTIMRFITYNLFNAQYHRIVYLEKNEQRLMFTLKENFNYITEIKFNGTSDSETAKYLRLTIENLIVEKIFDDKLCFNEFLIAIKNYHSSYKKMLNNLDYKRLTLENYIGFIKYLIIILEDIETLPEGAHVFFANQENKGNILSIINQIKIQLAFNYELEKMVIRGRSIELTGHPSYLRPLRIYEFIKENNRILTDEPYFS